MAAAAPNDHFNTEETTGNSLMNGSNRSSSTTHSNDEIISIKIKTLNNLTYDLSVLPDIPILELKAAVRNTTAIPEDRQRLIYRGKVLKDGDALSKYQVENGHTLHMVARPVGNNNESSASQLSNHNQLGEIAANNEGYTPSRRHQSRVDEWLANMASRTASVEALRSSVEALRNRRIAAEGPANSAASSRSDGLGENSAYGGSLEHIRQGALSIQTLLSTIRYTHSEEEEKTDAGETISRNRRFVVGQWLDVKDTVNQWLESTVIDISSTQILVHYNGWPSRWDEWINFDSDRISPFRTRTTSSHRSPYMSPTPNTWVRQAPLSAPLVGEEDVRSVILQTREAVYSVLPLIDSLADACSEHQTMERSLLQSSRGNVTNVSSVSDNTSEDSDLALELEDLDVASVVSENMPGSSSAHSSVPSRHASQQSLAHHAMTVAPLLDRLGRLLTDLAPQVHAIGSSTSQFLPNSDAARPIPSDATSEVSPQRDGSGYRDLILPSTQATSPQRAHGNIDIHIHAILTPVRVPTSSAASLQNLNVSGRSTGVTRTSVLGSSSQQSDSEVAGPETPLLNPSVRSSQSQISHGEAQSVSGLISPSSSVAPSSPSLSSSPLSPPFPSTPEAASTPASATRAASESSTHHSDRPMSTLSSILSVVRRTLQQYNERLNTSVSMLSHDDNGRQDSDIGNVDEGTDEVDDHYMSSFEDEIEQID